MTSLELLQRMLAHKLIGHLDLHLARFLLDHAEHGDPLLGVAAALTSAARSEGDVCLDLAAMADEPLMPGTAQALRLPSPQRWREILLKSGVVGQPGAWQPLILDDADRLYLHRYWDYEQSVGRSLISRSAQQVAGLDEEILGQGLCSLFAASGEAGTVDWQKIAAAIALLQRFCVISGGPGTGKTSTVVRILALLRQQPGGASLRIALAAPTGMAASRLQQSITGSKRELPLSADLLALIPEQALTLHRLLGVRRSGSGFRHHRDNPLPLDLLVLDEASMVDVSMMASLLEALPEQARLILLGDRDQLASVEAGAVLGDICRECEGAGSAFVERLRALTGEPLKAAPASRGRLRDNVAMLHRSYRFGVDSGIGQLAAAVNRGDAERVVKRLRSAEEPVEIEWRQCEAAAITAQHFIPLFDRLAAGAPIEELFGVLGAFRLLCALRGGPLGVDQMNYAITRRLVELGRVQPENEWYPGRPVMLTRNDYTLELYNGDLGIVAPHPDEPKRLAVAFASAAGPRWIAPARLPACETVYAMTVHKSQGSEFDHVMLQLPEQAAQVLCRELLYTAVTRARRRFTLVGSESVLRQAVSRSLSRHSGLSDLLRQGELAPEEGS
ncbi:MAG: exodeoxyribonuclease V subunit alpha [Candidatus Thiodiazotropha sp.]